MTQYENQELPTQDTTNSWVVCRTNGCRANGIYGHNFALTADAIVFCWACSQQITDIGPMDSLPSE